MYLPERCGKSDAIQSRAYRYALDGMPIDEAIAKATTEVTQQQDYSTWCQRLFNEIGARLRT